MKKGIIVLLTAMALSVFPVSVFAQDSHVVSSFGDNEDKESYASKHGPLPKTGFDSYNLPYKKKFKFVRFYLQDDNEKGMRMVIYDFNGKFFAEATTSKSNDYRVLIEKEATGDDGDYEIKIISNNGEGGFEYPFESAARAY